MIKGDRVRVHPHGSPQQAVEGTVALISENQLSILVFFDDRPEFANGPIVATDLGVPFFASRYEIEGKPWGPWIEIFNRGHYEIEETADERPKRLEDENL